MAEHPQDQTVETPTNITVPYDTYQAFLRLATHVRNDANPPSFVEDSLHADADAVVAFEEQRQSRDTDIDRLADYSNQAWGEFLETGLLWMINHTLHVFGYAMAVAYDEESGALLAGYPMKVSYYGFPREVNAEQILRVRRTAKALVEAGNEPTVGPTVPIAPGDLGAAKSLARAALQRIWEPAELENDAPSKYPEHVLDIADPGVRIILSRERHEPGGPPLIHISASFLEGIDEEFRRQVIADMPKSVIEAVHSVVCDLFGFPTESVQPINAMISEERKIPHLFYANEPEKWGLDG